ncbi:MULTISPECIES: inosine/xanthosine triphosphatase [Methanobacterium]|jgi:inosine/xanthosine triphosphatase|uniref:Probable inosine/xanthosine triphosphatase n=1 Tax=Methanobacterium formicicum TaxID=2162 RepID=A0A0S4FQ18_METFO|nr:inosine/xanthosine triphosphatase [Methanobacterium formicicum]CEL25143.1 putative non-canonical purine NTP phosphatase [Methanobacterium formicicum]
MKIIVGSKNPVKFQATGNVLEKIYGELEVQAIDVDSGVPDQPIGLEVTVQGAINRAKNAFFPDFDLSVGIESGLLEVPHSITGYLDLQWCAIYDGEKITLGVSAGFEYPPMVIEQVLGGREVGDVMDQVTGVNKLGQKTGAVSHLTQGMLDRTGNTEQCVLMAMVPRMNEGIYFG